VSAPKPSAAPAAEFQAPVEVPTEIAPEQGLDLGEAAGAEGGVAGGVPGGVVGGIVGGLPEEPILEPVRVGGVIKEPKKVRDVRPLYPQLALDARVQGVVIIEALVGPDGRVADAKVLRSVAMLDDAALEAVRAWVYTPTLLNGMPTPLIMTVTVTFRLRT
jgi:protein TonB